MIDLDRLRALLAKAPHSAASAGAQETLDTYRVELPALLDELAAAREEVARLWEELERERMRALRKELTAAREEVARLRDENRDLTHGVSVMAAQGMRERAAAMALLAKLDDRCGPNPVWRAEMEALRAALAAPTEPPRG